MHHFFNLKTPTRESSGEISIFTSFISSLLIADITDPNPFSTPISAPNIAFCMPPSCIKRSKMDGGSEFLEINGRKSEWANNSEDSWKSDFKKIEEILADAKRFVNILDGMVCTSSVVDDEEGFGMEINGVLSPVESNMLPLCHNGDDEKLDSSAMSMSSSVDTEFDQDQENENQEELINLQIGQNEAQRFRVLETLKVFEEQYVKLVNERKSEVREGRIPSYMHAHVEAAERVKKMGRCVSVDKAFGHVRGIEIGDVFRFRAELMVVGLHRQFVCGIDYVDVRGRKCATSVVESGQYANMAKDGGVLIYNGHGGNPKLRENALDQKLERGNLALVNSKEMGFPVRVIYKRRNVMACRTLGTRKEPKFVYVYDGLYSVNRHWQEREKEQGGKLAYKFELHRLSGQPKPREANARSRTGVRVQDDVSKGKEKFCVCVVNGVDDDLPKSFTYITRIIYPNWFKPAEPIGCRCTNGCSDSHECLCLMKNGGKILFNEKGAILEAKPRIYECGPSCKCPPACKNRVTQHGPRHQLEIFKTKSRGWGVRPRGFISSGSFVCEYVGELLRDKEAEQRVGNEEYMFGICDRDDEIDKGKSKEEGFALDAAVYGNIGRFINHSCSPNLFVQEVFYDKKVPHIMFFALKDIPHHRELTYRMGRAKDCYCGSPKCTGRMYYQQPFPSLIFM